MGLVVHFQLTFCYEQSERSNMHSTQSFRLKSHGKNNHIIKDIIAIIQKGYIQEPFLDF